MTPIADNLRRLGLSLPDPPAPVASYVPCVRTGNLVYVSGQIPMREGRLLATGTVPDRVSIEQAQSAAGQCVLNGLAAIRAELEGEIDRIRRIVRVGVFVASAPGFTQQPQVANGASDLLAELLGDAGRHARAAIGCIALPLDSPVEVELIVEVAL